MGFLEILNDYIARDTPKEQNLLATLEDNNLEPVKEMIKKHEGFRPKPYKDTKGNWTVGWGHLLKDGDTALGRDLGEVFEEDFQEAIRNYDSLGLTLDPTRKAVVIDMLFNLGLTKIAHPKTGFKKMLKALKEHDYDKAANEMVDSDWYHDVKRRGVTLVDLMRTGKKLKMEDRP